MQSVFRVTSLRRIQNQENQPQPELVSHRPRRTHTKSRRGCHNCKRRRVKCDENTDTGCRNCQRHGIDCDYLVSPSRRSAVVPVTNHATTSALVRRSTSSARGREYFAASPICPSLGLINPFPFQQPDDLAPILQTLSFFETFTCSTVTSIDGLGIFKGPILALSHQCDYLLHAILGMAAAHLRAMSIVMENPQESQRFSKTESYHFHRAIGPYRAELRNEPAPAHVDSLISTSMLLALHSFQVAGPQDTSFVTAPQFQRQAKLQWLVIPMGFPAVLRHVEQYLDISVWLKLFNSATPAEYGWTVDLRTADGIFAEFLDLCGISSDHDDEENPYKHALMDLFALLQIERSSMRDLGQIVAFMSRLNGSFQGLLVALDSAALLVLLYWLGILDNLGLWWARSRAAQEAHAIIDHLQTDQDARIQSLLRIPKDTFPRGVNV